ncbi:MAG: DUF2461 family protein, partial [Actinomycetia bacterium]|nr:DUF2461 family protein [Actinomycetes bacterium]
GGLHLVPKDLLEKYRKAVVNKTSGKELALIVKNLNAEKIHLMGKHYKRVPSGYDKDHQNSELLLHNGLGVVVQGPVPKDFYSAKLIDFCMKYYIKMKPLYKWILKYL